MEETKRLTSEQYWQWKCSVLEMRLSEEHLNNASLKVEIMFKDSELLKNKAIINKLGLTTYNEKILEAKKDYFKIKEEIEKSLGISLNNKAIDEFTLEIRDLEKE